MSQNERVPFHVGDKGFAVLNLTTPGFVAISLYNVSCNCFTTPYEQFTTNGAPDNVFTAGPISEEDFFTWEAVIEGHKDTPFEGGVFVAKLDL